MKVTRVKIDDYCPSEYGVCASATVYLDKSLVIHHLKVINGKGGLFIAFPNSGGKSTNEGGKKRYIDIVHPCTEDLRQEIESKVLEKYKTYEL